jgi:hypothetical protein
MASATSEEVSFIISADKENYSIGKLLSLTKNAVDYYYRGEMDILLQMKQPIQEDWDAKSTKLIIESLSFADRDGQLQSLLQIIKRCMDRESTVGDLVREKDGLRPIINLLCCGGTHDIHFNAAKALSILSTRETNKTALRRIGALRDIVHVVLHSGHTEKTKLYALYTLYNLASLDINQRMIRGVKGVPAVLSMLEGSISCQKAAIKIMGRICRDRKTRESIIEANGTKLLVCNVESSDPLVSLNAIKVMAYFCKSENHSEELKKAGFADAIIRVITKKYKNIKEINFNSKQILVIGLESLAILAKNSAIESRKILECTKILGYYLIVSAEEDEIILLVLKAIYAVSCNVGLQKLREAFSESLVQNIINLVKTYSSHGILVKLIINILHNILSKISFGGSVIHRATTCMLHALLAVNVEVKVNILSLLATVVVGEMSYETAPVFEKGGIAGLAKLFHNSTEELLFALVSLLDVVSSLEQLRMVIIASGILSPLLKALDLTYEQKTQLKTTRLLSKLLADEIGATALFSSTLGLNMLICALDSPYPEVQKLMCLILFNILNTNERRVQFEGTRGCDTLLSILLSDKTTVEVLIEVLKLITKLIQSAVVREKMMESRLMDHLRDLAAKDIIRQAFKDSTIVKALRNLIVALKVISKNVDGSGHETAAQPAVNAPQVPKMWIKCKHEKNARMFHVAVNVSNPNILLYARTKSIFDIRDHTGRI